ncbi:hypothetical protein [Solidesulfovibrio alcoholivorans]|uniref:hypothetical protein n=1 Tax=Solidesulfovibrio alcoholivorans TaxID=81406 RepID=UPI000495C37E|nr:hypothetical protein [Solidesulfovibrio alcoholivorans]
MMPLEEFETLAASYGTQLHRWPEESREAARELLATSLRAQAVFHAAAALDTALAKAGARELERLLPAASEAAALARLRRHVAARIAAPEANPRAYDAVVPLLSRWKSGLGYAFSLRLAGLATACSCAVMAGLVLGALYTTSPAQDGLSALLQPTPIAILEE